MYFASISEVSRLIQSKEVSPVELTNSMLARIEAMDGDLKSYATVTADRALAAAREAERQILAGSYLGPLHGVPVAVKDNIYTEGTRTAGGSGAYMDFLPEHDATVVSRLEQGGAVLLGKLNMTEGAMTAYHNEFGIPVNPWNSRYWSGASSSGSAVATVAGLSFGSLGTDTGGSIRFPCMATGVVGLKPTYGLVSRYGVLPLSETMDHIGPMTRRTIDAAMMLNVISGYDANDSTSVRSNPTIDTKGLIPEVKGMRIGVDERYLTEGVDPGLVEAIKEALGVFSELGAIIVEVEVPDSTWGLGEAWLTICASEAYKAHSHMYPSRASDYGPSFRDFLEDGASVTETRYSAATELRHGFGHAFNERLEQVDAIICPAGGVTFPVETDQYGASSELQPIYDGVQRQFTIPSNFTGTPALTVPCGVSGAGIPYAFQLLGRHWSEGVLCRLGHAYEEATGWHRRRFSK